MKQNNRFIRLNNAGYLQGRNAANSADVNIIRIDASNIIELASTPQVGGSDLITAASATNVSANKTLSNLTNPVALNQHLLPSATDTRDVGASGNRMRDVHAQQVLSGNDVSAGTDHGQPLLLGAAASGETTLYSPSGQIAPYVTAATRPVAVFTRNNAVNDATPTSGLFLETGNKTVGTAASGDIQIRTGTATGTRGKIKHQDGTEGTVGHILTSVDTVGSTAWAASPPIIGFDFGQGTDGTLAMNGSNTFATMFYKTGNTYFARRTIYASTVTISSGVTVYMGPYAMYVSGTLTNAGTIDANGLVGTNASGATGGVAPLGANQYQATANSGAPNAVIVAYGLADAGGDPTIGISGQDGSTTIGSIGEGTTAVNVWSTAQGGNPGKAGNGSAGTSPTPTTSQSILARLTVDPSLGIFGIDIGRLVYNGSFIGNGGSITGGSPGGYAGGGTGNSTQAGGGGGAGGSPGGVILIFANTINNTGTIRANGGKGGNGAAGTASGCGGGGGGGGGTGGFILIVARTWTATGTITVTAGALGTGGASGGGAGTAGASGTAGTTGIRNLLNTQTGVWS